MSNMIVNRRRMLAATTGGLALAGLPGFGPGAFADQLRLSATASEGPFYPDKMPLDTDNDLIIVNDAVTPAVGTVSHLSGRILTETGAPIRNAFVEIWQVDSNASYVHSKGRQPIGYDNNFQGYGRFLTDGEGRYYFRTIKPISYTLNGGFRTAHIHFAVSRNGKRIYTTQVLVKGLPENLRDGITRRLDAAALETLLVDFKPVAGSKIGELAANFDAVLGRTAFEDDGGTLRGVAPSAVQKRAS
jgi:protocatechuate 3,4-dioxygenase beta subunit